MIQIASIVPTGQVTVEFTGLSGYDGDFILAGIIQNTNGTSAEYTYNIKINNLNVETDYFRYAGGGTLTGGNLSAISATAPGSTNSASATGSFELYLANVNDSWTLMGKVHSMGNFPQNQNVRNGSANTNSSSAVSSIQIIDANSVGIQGVEFRLYFLSRS